MPYTLEYLLLLAERGGTLLDREYTAALTLDAQRWVQVNPDLGLPLALVQQVEQHQGSRRAPPPSVQEQIARLAEEILLASDDHDVRGWAWEILTLLPGK